jgi:very-short-patch-repair endonuclease
MREAEHVSTEYPTLRIQPPREAALTRLLVRQHGVVALAQLRELGLSPSAVRDRAASSRFHRVHRGVYAVGHPRLTLHGHWMAAVLACGPDALLSHRSAAALWGLRPDNRPKTDISLPRSSVRPKPGIEVHRSITLTRADVTAVDGIPCTTLARTLLDLADVLDKRSVERAIEQAEVLRLFDLTAVEDVLSRAGPRRGAGALRAILTGLEEPALTANDIEELFLALCRAASLPSPEVNVWLVVDDGAAIKADFLWRRHKLVIEIDGYASHGTRQAFESDRLRDQRLRLAGYDTVRFTWRQIVDDPDRVAATVAALLGRRAHEAAA